MAAGLGIYKKYSKYGTALNTHDLFKFVALVIMTIDHTGHYIFPDDMWWRAIGRITFPVWFFLVGYARNLSIRKDIVLLAISMIIFKATLEKMLFPVNALVTIILCRLLLQLMDRTGFLKKAAPLELFFICLIFLIPSIFLCEYGTQALLYAAMGYMVRNNMKQRKHQFFFVLTFLVFIIMQLVGFNFDLYQKTFAVAGTAYVTWLLYNYKIKEIHLRKSFNVLRDSVKFLARYSLYYYAIHITIFQIISHIMDPARYGKFIFVD